MSSKKVITLKASDNQTFEVTEEVALQSQTIKRMIEDECADNVIPLPNVTSKTLAKVIKYCKKHIVEEGNNSSSDDAKEYLKTFDRDFVDVDQGTLSDLMLAAHYLDINCLLDLTCQTVADMIKDETPEQIREIFNIQNDFTPKEEEEGRRENQRTGLWIMTNLKSLSLFACSS